MEENYIINLVLSSSFDEGEMLNNLIREGKIDLYHVVLTVFESGNAKAMYYLANYINKAFTNIPICTLEEKICTTNDFSAIIFFAEYVKGSNTKVLLDVAEQKVKENYPESSDDVRKAWLDKIDTIRFEMVLKDYRAKGISGVRENIELLKAITREEETLSLPTR